MVLEIMYIK